MMSVFPGQTHSIAGRRGDAPGVVVLSTSDGAVVVEDATAGLLGVTIARAHLTEAGVRWWRVDVVRPGARRTAVYGPVIVVDL